MKNTIYIVGAGAIGKTLAVFLKKAGKDVLLVRGSIDHETSRMEKIQVVTADKAAAWAETEVSSLSNFSQLNGIIVLTSKSFGNRDLAEKLKRKTAGSPVVILQNGLGVEQPFINLDYPEIYRCVLFATSQLTSKNSVNFKPVAISPIGIIKGNAARLAEIVEDLNNPDFPFQAEADIQTIIWKKAIINSVFNSICPLLGVDNGIFYREEKVLEIAKNVIAECVMIAKEKGIHLETDEVMERLLLISKSSDGQLISTLQDILNKRPTEIETLNFAIVDIAKKLNKENLVTKTRLLGELIKLKSDLSREKQIHRY